MKKKQNIRECDFCGKKVVADDEITYGGSPFDGWFFVEETSGSSQLSNLRRQKQWDLCSMKCLKQFAVASTVCPK